MRYFNLPDLGEGLLEAEIIEWHLASGEKVAADQILVTVETAKAIVEIPSPRDGVVAARFGQPGDIVHVGEPLVEFVTAAGESQTVVGELHVATRSEASEDHFIIGSAQAPGKRGSVRAMPSVRALAKRLNVDISRVTGGGPDGLISAADIERAARLEREKGPSTPLRGVRRFMAKSMALSRDRVVPVTINDDCNLANWPDREDPTMRLLKAIVSACEAEPMLNSWLDDDAMTYRQMKTIDVSMAVDTPDGLFAPVLRDIGKRSVKDLRQGLERLKRDVMARTIPPAEMLGATIGLSNFGMIAGRYANPVIVPPTVAIIAAGSIRDEVWAIDKRSVVIPVMPLSLTFDHRLITGGEAARFLAAMKMDLEC